MSNSFIEIQRSFGEEIPPDIAHILEESGFDTKTSLLNIDASTIMEIEEFVNKNRQILAKTSFDGSQTFRFKPGHKKFILNLSIHFSTQFESTNIVRNGQQDDDYNDFSYILKSLIDVAKLNSRRDPKGFRYNESIQYFATYIYLLCGRACYEALSANLPIPQANTIRKFIHFRVESLAESYILIIKTNHFFSWLCWQTKSQNN